MNYKKLTYRLCQLSATPDDEQLLALSLVKCLQVHYTSLSHYYTYGIVEKKPTHTHVHKHTRHQPPTHIQHHFTVITNKKEIVSLY